MSPLEPWSHVLPEWPSTEAVESVGVRLAARPALVGYQSCWRLRRRLADVALGHAVVVQAGDCAEMFDEVSPEGTRCKRAQLEELGALLARAVGRPAVLVGRMAGQFAKPRSCGTEPGPYGSPLPVYRGDAVNGAGTTLAARRPDPQRLLRAYDVSANVLAQLGPGVGTEVWTSHEALLPEYEVPLVRRGGPGRVRYGSSGHLLWIGERTRTLDSPQVRLLAGLDNPIGVKLGPSTSAAELTALIDRLDPGRQPGRLVLISRLGADLVEDRLPGLVRAATAAGARPVWLCDPMHGNTVKLPDGRKTRALEDVEAEVRGFVAVLNAHGRPAGGLHLETTPDDVTECVDERRSLSAPELPRYRTSCDPRLNPRQAAAVTAAFGTALEEGAAA